MGQGLLSSNGELEDRDDYSIYAGAIFPMPYETRLGIEYNYGSKYWFNFTGAEDSLVGSKLAARGHVLEGYYIQPIFKTNFFLILGGMYYDYEYTGRGNPIGEPVKITDLTSVDALNAVVDRVWLAYCPPPRGSNRRSPKNRITNTRRICPGDSSTQSHPVGQKGRTDFRGPAHRTRLAGCRGLGQPGLPTPARFLPGKQCALAHKNLLTKRVNTC